MLTIAAIDARVTHVATRIPFRYGIAEMTKAPHVVLAVTLRDAAGRSSTGYASEHLPPKWFTKDPDSVFTDDIADMVAAIEHAVAAAEGLEAETVFALWQRLDAAQAEWARAQDVPGLLAGLGTALVERALIDAGCRLAGIPFARALHEGALGFEPAAIHPELDGLGIAELFDAPARTIAVRHTVGLSDPLTDDEVVDRPGDALPISVEASILRYGVTHFKVKTAGQLDRDIERLHRILDLTQQHGIDAWFTIDGNESMTTADHLVQWAEGLLADARLAPVLAERLIAVEQPFHRSIALGEAARDALARLSGRIAVIIDESDDAVATVREAMDLGYAGGTYKGCKGVFRGLANAALVRHRGDAYRTRPDATALGTPVLTAEDLSTLPPLTVPQDLVVAAVMGLGHIERNGHHYFGRLAPVSPGIEDAALAAHAELYERQDDGAVRLRIERGQLALGSILAAPFGLAAELDLATLEPLSAAAAARGM